MASQDNSSGSVFVAFALGAIAGAAVALLYAPAAGDETRRRLAEKAREGRERAERIARDGREFVTRQRENLNSAVERGREAFDRGREAYDQARKETL
ncbi:MAG: YtxH domain-containing protein [Acidobacteriota bacterium]